jgi:hypothetical protein
MFSSGVNLGGGGAAGGSASGSFWPLGGIGLLTSNVAISSLLYAFSINTPSILLRSTNLSESGINNFYFSITNTDALIIDSRAIKDGLKYQVSPTVYELTTLADVNYVTSAAGAIGNIKNSLMLWKPAGNSTTITATGAQALTITGTATASNVDPSNNYTKSRCLEALVTVASPTAVAGFRAPTNQVFLRDGFTFSCRFGIATGASNTTNRMFVGLTDSIAAPTDVNPTTLTNAIGVGFSELESVFSFYNPNGFGVSATAINRPFTNRSETYEVVIKYDPLNVGNELTCGLTELSTGVNETVLMSGLSLTTLLSPRIWISVGGTSSVIGLGLIGMAIQTPY